MSHIDQLRATFDAIGVFYIVRTADEYQYIFLIGDKDDYKDEDLDTLLRKRLPFFEFCNGELASY